MRKQQQNWNACSEVAFPTVGAAQAATAPTQLRRNFHRSRHAAAATFAGCTD
ncbi:hypothetical protein GLE_0556 [Lysobacter enzymogenes]|uniref:Uncharacterized protein n=1 Tax=Lysobacter enzymogenes TaxID=69 RepID=A0A0S2DBN1_LYSEN|nr:hypothetical protein GLE_0556 [Lysobacter enzymogenes]